jgi:hypothetical protein
MRTTITLEDDLAETLRRRARERNVPFKQVVNEAIRAGLTGGKPASKRYRMKPGRPLGIRPGINMDRALQLAAELEDEEIIRKLEQGR